MDKAKGVCDWGWEVEMGGVGDSGGGKMETIVLEQQSKMGNNKSSIGYWKDSITEKIIVCSSLTFKIFYKAIHKAGLNRTLC